MPKVLWDICNLTRIRGYATYDAWGSNGQKLGRVYPSFGRLGIVYKFAAADHGQHPELEEQRWDSEMQAIWTVARYWEERL